MGSYGAATGGKLPENRQNDLGRSGCLWYENLATCRGVNGLDTFRWIRRDADNGCGLSGEGGAWRLTNATARGLIRLSE